MFDNLAQNTRKFKEASVGPGVPLAPASPEAVPSGQISLKNSIFFL